MTRLAHLIQYGGGEGEKTEDISLIVQMFDSNWMSGYEIPPSSRGSEEVVVDAGWIWQFCHISVQRMELICFM